MYTHQKRVDVFVYMVFKVLRLVTGPCSNISRVLMYLSIWYIWLLD